MTRTKLTICIPTYNRATELEKCIEHALKCKSCNIEVLVSDNGSDDHTLDILQGIEDKRFRYIKNDENLGFAFNLIKVVEQAKSPYVYLLSDEDALCTKYIDSLLKNELDNEIEYSLIYGSIYNDLKQNYVKKRKNDSYKGNIVFSKFTFSHAYLSGMIINRNGIDFKKMHKYLNAEKHLLYPHEIMALMSLKQNPMAITKSSVACFQGEALESQILKETPYTKPKHRLEVYDQFFRIAKDLNINAKSERNIINVITNRITNTLVAPFNRNLFNEEYSKQDYLKDVIQMFRIGPLKLTVYILLSKVTYIKKKFI